MGKPSQNLYNIKWSVTIIYLSRGEIFVVNFILAGNGVSKCSYLVKIDFFNQKGWKRSDKNSSGSQTCKPFLKRLLFFFVYEYLTPYTGVCRFFLSDKFATSLLASLEGDYILSISFASLLNVKYSWNSLENFPSMLRGTLIQSL